MMPRKKLAMTFEVREDSLPPKDQVLNLYRANHWSSAEKPDALMAGLAGSHSLVSAWAGETLVGLGNALSDGHLVVYYPHLIVHPDWQGKGVGAALLQRMQARYRGLHQQILIADGAALGFYQRMGFRRAGKTEPMWIYDGNDH
jgi:GNAT superfamily N-acetyltransferase